MLTISAAPILEELVSAKTVIVDTETSSLHPWRDGNVLAGLGVKVWGGTPFYMPVAHAGAFSQAPPEELAKVLEALQSHSYVLVMHHAKFDLAVCEQAGFDLSDRDVLCTVVMAGLVREDEKSYELKALGRSMLNDPTAEDAAKALREYMRNAGYPGRYNYVPPHVMEPYACQDLCLTEGLRDYCEPLIRERGLTDLLKLEMRLTRALYRSERLGVRLDRPFIEEEMGRAGEMAEALSRQIFEMAGEEFNPGSATDVRRIFQKLEIKSPTTTKKGGESFAKDAMAKIEHPIADAIVLWRSLEHNRSGYYLSFLAKAGIDEDGEPVLHSEINQAGASTGRMSSRSPNVMNIVATPPYEKDEAKAELVDDLKHVLAEGGDTRRFVQTVDPQDFDEDEEKSALDQELVRKVRGAFIPRPGTFFLFADYSQVEIRSYAAYAQERDLLRVFDYGLDIHAMTALAMHGLLPPAGTPEYDVARRGAKGFSFGLIFGMGLNTLALRLGKTKDEAQVFRDSYFTRYPHAQEFAQWVEDTVRNPDRQDARGYGYLVNLWGRRYYLHPDKAYVGVNRLVQGSCADMLKQVYSDVSETLWVESYRTELLIPIHDEIIYEMPFAEFETAIPRSWEVMVDVPKFGTPLRVDLSWSPTRWSEKKSLACNTCDGVGKTSKISGEEALDAIYRGDEVRLAQAELATCVKCAGRGYDLTPIREYVAAAA